jgi:hypothetical protein
MSWSEGIVLSYRNLLSGLGARMARGPGGKQGRKAVRNLEFSVLVEVAVPIQSERY